MSTGADDETRLYLAVDEPGIAGAFIIQAGQRADGDALTYFRAAAAQKVFIELAAADAKADDVMERDFNFTASHTGDAKTGDGLQSTAMGVSDGINVESAQDCGRDPSAANFVARERGFVQDKYFQSAGTQGPGTR
jgi:hypothetical protein